MKEEKNFEDSVTKKRWGIFVSTERETQQKEVSLPDTVVKKEKVEGGEPITKGKISLGRRKNVQPEKDCPVSSILEKKKKRGRRKRRDRRRSMEGEFKRVLGWKQREKRMVIVTPPPRYHRRGGGDQDG